MRKTSDSLDTAVRRGGRNMALDGLRGYAAAAVVIYHGILGCSAHTLDVLSGSVLAQTSRYDQALKVALSLVNGELAVALFFVMSGLVLSRALAGMDASGGPAFGLSWRFLLRRLLRLWPVMAVCLVVHTVVLQAVNAADPGFTELHTWRELIENLTLANASVIGATWTLAVELAAAPWLLVSYLGVRRWGILPMLPVFAGGIVVLRFAGLLANPAGMLMGLPMLLAGGVIESVSVRGWVAPRWWRVALPAGLVVALGDELFVSLHEKAHALLLLPGSALIVGGVANVASGTVRRFLERPLSGFLGRISYSLYLWNVLILLLVLGLAGRVRENAHPLEMGLAVGLAAVLATIPLASLSERWLERPSIGLGRALTRRAVRRQGQTGDAALSTQRIT